MRQISGFSFGARRKNKKIEVMMSLEGKSGSQRPEGEGVEGESSGGCAAAQPYHLSAAVDGMRQIAGIFLGLYPG
jgi:hypothetical protein